MHPQVSSIGLASSAYRNLYGIMIFGAKSAEVGYMKHIVENRNGIVAVTDDDAAIVYGSDRFAAPELATAYTFPEDSHKPIVYPAAETANGNDGVVKFLDFLSSEAGQKNFVAFGFAPAKK